MITAIILGTVSTLSVSLNPGTDLKSWARFDLVRSGRPDDGYAFLRALKSRLVGGVIIWL